MMRVLRVITTMNPESGGPCQGIRNSVPAMQALGVETEVVCFDHSDVTYGDNFVIHPIGPAKGPYQYCKDLKNWLLLNFERFDAVIIHGLWLHNSYGTYKAWREYQRTHTEFPRLYVMPHGMLDPYFQRAKERRIKAFRNSIFWQIFESKVINNCTGVLFTCEQELLLAREPFSKYRPNKELNASYGIQPPPELTAQMKQAFLQKLPEVGDRAFWLFLSRVHSKKGVDLLIKAYNRFSKGASEVPALVIAGPGMDTKYGSELKKLAKNQPHIYFPGMLKGAAKWGAFYKAEAFVLPSHQENFGIAVVEALACGTPVLISDKVNIYREISQASAGLVAADTEEGVYQLLKQWQQKEVEEKKMASTKAKSCYQNYFTIENAAKQLLKRILNS